jgi:hypothetical protein
VSRPNITDEIVDGLGFARACVLDQRIASHARGDRTWDARFAAALAAIDVIAKAHSDAARAKAKKAKKARVVR